VHTITYTRGCTVRRRHVYLPSGGTPDAEPVRGATPWSAPSDAGVSLAGLADGGGGGDPGTVIIKMLSGQHINVPIAPGCTVFHVKEGIQEQTGWLAAQQRRVSWEFWAWRLEFSMS
jgi:hypothetical protein